MEINGNITKDGYSRILTPDSITASIGTSVDQDETKDQLAEADSFSTIRRDGAVKLKMTNGMGSIPPKTIVSFLREAAEKIPNSDALCVKRNGTWQRWTYKDYYNDSCRVAKSLIKIGLKPSYSVAILGFNSPEWILADMGAIFAGGIAVGIYTTNSAEACQFVASDSKANVIVVEDTQYLQKILKVKDNLPDLKAIVQYTGEIEEPQPNFLYSWEEFMKLSDDVPDASLIDRLKSLRPNKCCTLVYTSGTTGNPKGVMLSHDNLVWCGISSTSLNSLLQYGREKIVSYLPLSHSAAQAADICISIKSGCCVYFAQPDALKGSLVATLKEVRPTIFFGVPRVWEKIMERMRDVGRDIKGFKLKIASWAKGVGLKGNQNKLKGGDVPFGWMIANALIFKKVKENLGFDQCTAFLSGAAPLSKETYEYFMSLDIVIDEAYGLSESTAPVAISTVNDRKAASVGKILPGLKMKLTDPDAEGAGEICMYGRNIFMGYLEQEEKTNEVFDSEGYLRTGDIGKTDQDGFLYITGRIKEIIITAGGENVAPIPIEDSVKAVLPIISNCMLIGDKRKFLSMLITIKCEVDLETMQPLDKLNSQALHWCQSVGSNAKTVTEVIKDNAARKAIQDGIIVANKKSISRATNIQKWTIIGRDFSIFGGEFGPTLKLKRPVVCKMYQETIDEFYKE